MQKHLSVCRSLRICWLAAAVLMLSSVTASAQLTWDSNTTLTGPQNTDGSGGGSTPGTLQWNTTNSNWWNGTANTSWVNSTSAIAQFGTSIPTPALSNPISVTEDIVLKELRFLAVTTGTISSGQQFVINGDVAGRVIDFGANGLIQMEDRSSGGSQFASLGSNLRLKGSNLRIQKYGSGTAFQYLTLSMITNPDLTGTFTVGGSMYVTLSAPGTVQAVDRIIVEAGGSVVLSGTGATYTQAFSLAGIGNSLTFSGTAYGAIRIVSNNITLSGPITLTADSGIHTNFGGANGFSGTISGAIGDNGGNFSFNRFTFTRGGDSVITLTAANTYGGATILGRNVPSYSGGTTVLDFSAAGAPQNNILYNGLATPGNLVLASGNSATTLRLVGNAGQTNSQAFKDLSISGAYNVLELISGTGGTMNMSFGNFSRVELTAVLSVLAPLSGTITTTQAAGFAGPWMTYTTAYGARSWAQVAGGVVTGGYAGDTALATGQNLGAAPFTATSNASITSATSGPVTAGAGTTNLNTLSTTDVTSGRLVQLGAGQTLRLGTQGGIQLLNGAQDLTIGTAGAGSILSAGGAVTNTAGVLFLTNLSSTGTLIVNSVIANNGTGAVTLVSNGAPGTRTALTAVNTFTGPIQISSGILEMRNAGALGTTGLITVLDGATLALSGDLTITRALGNIEGFGDGGNGAIRSLSGTNTITGVITMGAPTLITADAGSVLNLGTAPTSNILAGAFFVTFGGSGTINVGGAIGAVSGLVKTGLGTLVLSGTNTYTGAVTVNLGTVKLGSAATMITASTSSYTVAAGGTVDLNGFSVSTAVNLSGAGTGSGALISSSGPGTLTGTVALTAATLLGGSNDLTINNAGGLTGSVLLTKTGSGTLTFISTASSARSSSATNQIDAGTLRVQATAASITPLGLGTYALNGGTLSLGFDATSTYTNVVNVIKDSTIIADRASSGAGGTVITLSTLTIGGNTLTVKAGSNITSSTIGLTLGAVNIGGVSMRPGNPVFDAQSTASAALTLTLGSLSDQAIAPRTLTFQNSGAVASTITLGVAATSLVDGTMVNVASTGGAVTLNLATTTSLGALAQVTLGTGNTLNLSAANTIGSLSGSGNITGAFVLTVGNASNASVLSTTYSGVLGFGGTATGLTKSGLGTLTLSGANAYTGATAVSLGTLKLNSATALGATSGVAITAAGTLDLNGQNTDRNFTIGSTGINSNGGLINSSTTTATITGTTTLGSGSNIGGSGNITFNNSTGLIGNYQLTKIGTGTLTIIDTTTTSARTGANQINAGTLRLESTAATAISPLGTGGWLLYGGTLSLGFDVANASLTGGVALNNSATIITDVATLNNAAVTQTLGGLTVYNNSTLTVKTGANVAAGGTQGLTMGAVTLNGNATFDVQNSAGATTKLTLGAITDLAIAPRTMTFTNTGAATTNSQVVLATAAASLVDGTQINLSNGANAGVTLNLNIASALGTLAQVNVSGNSVLTLGAAQTVASLAGSGTVNASGIFTLTVGNGGSSAASDTEFSGVLANGTGTLALTKNGTGTLTLSGSTSNTYTGATQVNTGTLVLAKTGGATAIGLVPPPTPPATGTTTSLIIGAAAASTAGNATVRLEADNQMLLTSSTDAGGMVINAGGTLDLNGHTLTITTLAGVGSTVTGGGTLIINRTGGTLGFSGISSISSTLQITTANSLSATRTIAVGVGSVADRLTISGNITQGTFTGAIVAGNSTGTAIGSVILSGTNSYTGATTVSSGILNIRNGSALGTTTAGTSVTNGGTLQIQDSITTLAEALTLNGTGFVGANGVNIQTGAFVNVSGVNNYAGLIAVSTAGATISSDSGTLNLTNAGTMTGSSQGLTLAGAGDGSISSIIGPTIGILTKNGTGTWTLKGANTSASGIAINAGILKLGDGTAGNWINIPSLTYTGSGTFEYGGNTMGVPQALSTLTLSAGGGVLKVDTIDLGTNSMTFTSLVTALGTGLNIISPADTSVTISGTTNTNGIINARLTYNGADFASSTGGVIGAAATTTATSSLTAGNLNPYLISGSFAQTTSVTVNAGLKFTGGNTLTLGSGILLTINNGTDTAGGILITGGVAAVIADAGGATGLTTAGNSDLVIGTNATGDSLSIQVAITNTTTGGLTKNGAGTLTLTVANAYTGTTSINAGTLILGNAAAMSTSAATVQAGAVLNLNGKIIINTATLNGTGISNGGALVNNSGTAAAIGALTIGLGNGVGGIGASIGGTGDIASTGALVGDSNILVKTGSGTLTFGDNGGVAIASLRIGATRIDAGTLRISNSSSAIGTAAAAIILNGGTLSLGSSASVVAYPVSVTASSTIISDAFNAGAGINHTLGVLTIGAQTLTIRAGGNITTAGTTAGVIFGATTLLDNPTFDVQSPTAASNGTTALTLGSLNDLGVAKTITITNSGTSGINSSVILNAAMTSLLDGTVVNINAGANAGVTLSLNVANVLGTLTQVTVNGKSVLSLGAAQTIGSLSGTGNIIGAFALTVGNANSSTVFNTDYSGVLGFGGVATALTKSGLGTLTLSGANAYTGATIINLGTLKLNSSSALGATSGVTISAGGTLDLNGQTTARNFTSVNGTGINSGGAIINSSSTTGTITGTVVLNAVSSIGGSGNITISNTTGVTGNVLLTKIGTGTLTIIDSTTTSARNGPNQLNAGTLRLESAAATAVSPLGTSGAWTLNGGILSLGFNTANALMTGTITLNANATIITDVATLNNVAVTHTMGGLVANNDSTLTVQTGANVAAGGTQGLTLGGITLNGNVTFDVQNSASVTTRLTLGGFTDTAISPRTITFNNTGTATTNSLVTLSANTGSLVDGTVININNGTSAGVTVTVATASALGGVAQVNVNGNSVLTAGTDITLGSLSGTGTVNTNIAAKLTIGSTSTSTALNTEFSGTLANGTGTLTLVKSGLGTLTLGGTNSYTGTTTVSLGILKLNSATALGATSGVLIGAGGTLDLNGQSTDRNFTSINGTGHNGIGALINSSSTTAIVTGTTVLAASSKIGGSGNIIISNAGGLTGSVLLTKIGSGTVTFISTALSARTGTNQIDEGTLRVQAATVISSLGSGAMTLNGGTLSLGFDASGITGTGVTGNAVNVLASSTIIADRASAGAGGLTFTMGSVIIGGSTLTVKAGDNVTSGTIGLTLTTITIGGPALAPGNPIFDVQSTSTASTILTLGTLTDQAIAARTITFQNSSAAASSVILGTAATSLLDGTQILLANTGGAITLNLNIASAIGTLSQVTMAAGNTLALGASQTISSLNGSGTVSATASSVLTIGNPLSPLVLDSTFNGALTGANLSVVKAGSGTMTLGGSADNTLSGSSGLAVNSGTLILAKTGGAVAVSSKLTIGTVGAVSGSATVRLAGASQIATTTTVIMNAQSFLDLNGYNTTLGAVIGTPGGTILNNATGTATTLTVGAGDATGQHLGSIVDNTSGTGTVALTKTGSGAFVLGGNNTYTGATLVQSGSLQVGVTGMGTTGTGAVTVQSGATLLGTGVVQGSSFTAASGSTIQAGDSTAQGNFGTITFKPSSGSGVIDFQAGSTIVLGINPGGTSDLLNIVGTGSNTVLFSGNITVTAAAFTPTAPAVFNLIDWSGLTAAPTFDSRFNYTGSLFGNGDEASGFDLPDITGSGYSWDVSNFTTNGTIALVLVPEPSRWLLLGLGLGILLMRRRR